MKRIVLAIGVCVLLAGVVAMTLAQNPGKVTVYGEAVARPAAGATSEAPAAFERQTLTFTRDGDVLAFTTRLAPDAAVQKSLGEWKAAVGKEAEQKKIEQQLRQSLKEQFDARISVYQKEIEQLEAKVKKLREQLDLRRKKQDEIVDFRLQQLLREAQGLGWGTEPVTEAGGAAHYRSYNLPDYRPGANVPSSSVRAVAPASSEVRSPLSRTEGPKVLGERVTQPKAVPPSAGTSNRAK